MNIKISNEIHYYFIILQISYSDILNFISPPNKEFDLLEPNLWGLA